MWMTQIVRETKLQLRDVYGLTPSRYDRNEPCFDKVPDGLYQIEVEGKTYWVVIISDKFHFLEKKEPRV